MSRANDITGKCRLAEIKVGSGKVAGGALWETGCRTAPRAEHGLHQLQEESLREEGGSEGLRAD